MKIIDRPTLQQKLASGRAPILLEALPERYWRDAHLPGARLMPHDQVKALASSLVPDKSAEIVVYCSGPSCRNSHMAAQTLSLLGYTDVAVYPGGKSDWAEAGLPVERG